MNITVVNGTEKHGVTYQLKEMFLAEFKEKANITEYYLPKDCPAFFPLPQTRKEGTPRSAGTAIPERHLSSQKVDEDNAHTEYAHALYADLLSSIRLQREIQYILLYIGNRQQLHTLGCFVCVSLGDDSQVVRHVTEWY